MEHPQNFHKESIISNATSALAPFKPNWRNYTQGEPSPLPLQSIYQRDLIKNLRPESACFQLLARTKKVCFKYASYTRVIMIWQILQNKHLIRMLIRI
jgi:hypothetical protein